MDSCTCWHTPIFCTNPHAFILNEIEVKKKKKNRERERGGREREREREREITKKVKGRTL